MQCLNLFTLSTNTNTPYVYKTILYLVFKFDIHQITVSLIVALNLDAHDTRTRTRLKHTIPHILLPLNSLFSICHAVLYTLLTAYLKVVYLLFTVA